MLEFAAAWPFVCDAIAAWQAIETLQGFVEDVRQRNERLYADGSVLIHGPSTRASAALSTLLLVVGKPGSGMHR